MDNSGNSGVDPSNVEVPVDSPAHPIPEGMSRGYTMSPMAELQLEYMKEMEEESSIFSRVTLIASKISLELWDVIDRGIDPSNPVPRFGLDPGFALRVWVTISDMQSILQRAASLVPGCTSHFVIDPRDAILPILRGASGLEELNAAWLALHRRMQLAQGYLRKYDQHYQTPEENLRSQSPLSTNTDVYERWPVAKPQSVQLTYLFDNVRHHQDQVPKGYDRDTDDILSFLKPSDHLSAAFPDREPSYRPLTVYCSTAGERKERAKPTLSSWGAGNTFHLPSDEILGDSRATHEEPVEPDESDGDYEPETRVPNRDSPSSGYYYPSMSAQTPFKNSGEFFAPKSPSYLHHELRVLGHNLPDPIRGMASAAPYGLPSDSVSQALKARHGVRRTYTRHQS
jgi:hypothetical protein